MYVLQNAVRNLFRNKGRNILVGAIVFAIITGVVVALCINNTSKGIIDEQRERFGSEVFLMPNMDKFMSAPNGAKTSLLRVDQFLAFAESEYIKEFYMALTQDLASENLKAVDEIPLQGGDGGFVVESSGSEGGDPYVNPQMVLKGDTWDDFNTGTKKVVDGNMAENPNECLISQELAELNGLSVGDAVAFKGSVMTQEGTFRTVSYDFTVSGIYYDASDPYSGRGGGHFSSNKRNQIFTKTESVINMLKPGEHTEVATRYFLKNPSMLDAYEAELREKGLGDFYDVETDEAGYKKVVGPVEGLRGISITFMVIVLILGSIILILLSSIAIRERKYEIGVLRAMGMKKRKVALGLWAESLVITLTCLLIGLGAGALASQPVTDALLAGQIENAKAMENSQSIGGQFYIAGVGNGEVDGSLTPLEELDVSLDFDTIWEIVAIAIILASIASVASIVKITKYEPIKILMERN